MRETLALLDIPALAKDRIAYVVGPKGDTDEYILVGRIPSFKENMLCASIGENSRVTVDDGFL